jgi:23S rRNA pseudouridine1911/1915/1917 synthase
MVQVQVVGDGLTLVISKAQAQRTLLDVLVNDMLLPENFIKQCVRNKAITIHNEPVSLSTTLSVGQRVRLSGGVEAPFGVVPCLDESSVNLNVLYEDDHMMVVNKPAGVIIYPGDGEDTSVSLAHLVAGYYAINGLERKVMHVHRLDKDTTGAILYAKHIYSLRALDALLRDRQIRRTYLALVRGRLPQIHGVIDAPIGRDRHVSGRYRVSNTGKHAVTRYRVLGSTSVGNDLVSLVECTLETGRTHQIRVHLSHCGCPIVGDTLYGAPRGIGSITWEQGFALHAWKISFTHPYEMTQMEVLAPWPNELKRVTSHLGLSHLQEVNG